MFVKLSALFLHNSMCNIHLNVFSNNILYLFASINVGSSFGNVAVDSARQNLASSFVNAFLNAGFGADKLLMDEKSKWIYKNKDMGKIYDGHWLALICIILGSIYPIYCISLRNFLLKHPHGLCLGMMSTTASLGLILLWDVDGGLTQIDKYLYSAEDHIKAGALLACGIVNSGVRNECDPALALLSDYILHSNNIMRVGAVVG